MFAWWRRVDGRRGMPHHEEVALVWWVLVVRFEAFDVV